MVRRSGRGLHAKEQRLDLLKIGGSVHSVKRWQRELRNVERM